MVNLEILTPAAALCVWTLIMLVWMAATRLPALAKLKIPAQDSRGKRGSDLDGVLPPEIMWKAHNYNHLVEQPTVFYAVVVMLALAGASELDVTLAWVYFGLRIVHSLWQALVNTIPVRITIFTISSLVLTVLAVRALMVLI